MKIPDDRKPSYEVTINGVKNFFDPGTEVGGDVASALFGTETFPPAPPETDKPFNIPIPAPGSTVSANPTLAGTEDSLNGIEIDGTKYAVGGGSGGGVLVVHVDENDTLDKTWQEIKDASLNGVVILIDENAPGYLASCSYVPVSTPPTWMVKFNRNGLLEPYATEDGADGYPVYSGT